MMPTRYLFRRRSVRHEAVVLGECTDCVLVAPHRPTCLTIFLCIDGMNNCIDAEIQGL